MEWRLCAKLSMRRFRPEKFLHLQCSERFTCRPPHRPPSLHSTFARLASRWWALLLGWCAVHDRALHSTFARVGGRLAHDGRQALAAGPHAALEDRSAHHRLPQARQAR